MFLSTPAKKLRLVDYSSESDFDDSPTIKFSDGVLTGESSILYADEGDKTYTELLSLAYPTRRVNVPDDPEAAVSTYIEQHNVVGDETQNEEIQYSDELHQYIDYSEVNELFSKDDEIPERVEFFANVAENNDPSVQTTNNSSEQERVATEQQNKLFREHRAALISKTRKVSEDLFKNKLLREHGKPYIGRKTENNTTVPSDKQEKNMKPACSSAFCKKSKNRFCDSFSEIDRKENFNDLWQKSWEAKRSTVAALVEKIEPARERNRKGGSSHTMCIKYYLFKNDGSRYAVCKTMFCNTLGLSRRTIHKWLKRSKVTTADKPATNETTTNETATNETATNETATNETATNETATNETATHEMENLVKPIRKRSVRNHNYSAQKKALEDFLDKLPRVPSHYCRASSSREYLQRPFYSIRQVYRLYVDDNVNPLSWKSFLEMFKIKKLSIFLPKKDECNYCALVEGKKEDSEHYKEQKRAQVEKAKDKALKDPSTYVACADVQSAMSVPQLFVNAAYYRSKLNCHNYTIQGLNDEEVDVYFWTEDEGGCEADVFISFLLEHLKNVMKTRAKTKRIVLYTDSCPAQNKNLKLSNALCHFSVTNNVTIEQKFLVVGHTYMEADSTHSMIERQIRKPVINSPAELIDLIKGARIPKPGGPSPFNVHYKKADFFQSHKTEYYSSVRPGVGAGAPKVMDLRALKYTPSGDIAYKLSFDDEYAPLPLENKLQKPSVKPATRLYRKKPGLTESKKKHLTELLPYIHNSAHQFFNALIK